MSKKPSVKRMEFSWEIFPGVNLDSLTAVPNAVSFFLNDCVTLATGISQKMVSSK
jgi:hypothetical protein